MIGAPLQLGTFDCHQNLGKANRPSPTIPLLVGDDVCKEWTYSLGELNLRIAKFIV